MPADASPFRSDAFTGLADDYIRYRLPYPPAMLTDLLAEAGAGPAARVLDLGCGTGRVALALATRVGEVWGVDPEPEMLAAAQREAARLGIANVRWSVGRAETLEAPPGAFDLITIGEAFHRMDRPRVAALAFGWLAPGGALVTLGGESLMDGEAPWRRVLAGVAQSFIGVPARRLGAPNADLAEEIADQTAALASGGFGPITEHPFAAPHTWTLEELKGNLRSMSVLSRRALGERHAAFEAALAAALLAYDPAGRYPEVVRLGYTVAHRP